MMKKTILISLLILVAITYLNAKPIITVKLVNSFDAPVSDPQTSSVLYGATESVLIMAELQDTLPNRVFCYDFQGNPVDYIKLPADSISGSTYGIHYLPESKLLTYSDGNVYLHYVNFDGQDKGKRKFTGSMISLFVKVLEFQGTQYLMSWNPYEAWDFNSLVTQSTTLYRVEGDSLFPLRKRVFEKDLKDVMKGGSFSAGTMTWGLLTDSNLNHNMVLVDEKDSYYQVTFSTPDSVYAFRVKRSRKDLMYSVYAGYDFLYLGIFKPNGKLSRASGIYNLHGKRICTSKQFHKLTGNSYIIDMVGNKTLVHNGKEKKIQVYETSLINP